MGAPIRHMHFLYGRRPHSIYAFPVWAPPFDVCITRVCHAEVLGIAEGAGAPLGDVLMLTFLDEVWGLTGAASDGGRHPGAAAAAAAAGPVGCTTLAGALPSRAGGAGTVAGQTMDLPRWTEGRLAVLRVSGGAGERASLVMTCMDSAAAPCFPRRRAR